MTLDRIHSFPLDLSAVDLAEDFFGNDPILSIPSVQILKVSDQTMDEHALRKTVMMCPNLKELLIDDPLTDFPTTAAFIWTHMKNLQSLSFSYRRVDKTCAVDFTSAVTGISKENCQILLDKIKKIHEKPMPASKKWKAVTGFKISELEVEKMRENISILDLKGNNKMHW